MNLFRVNLSLIFLGIVCSLSAQRISVSGNKLVVNGSPIYMNGCNTPWDNWNDFGGNYNPTFWEAEFARFETYGINSTRIWFSCNGDVGINIDANGVVSGATQAFWDDCDDLMARAESHKIYIMATVMSFDHTKNTYQLFERWRKMLASATNVQSYIDNFLVPFVERYKDNPYLFNIDLCNEMEWMNQNTEEGNIPWTQLQRYAAMSAAGVHKSQSEVTVSLGSAAVKWGSDAKNIQGSKFTGNCEGNVWSDAKLQAQFNDPEAFLDIWQVHYYDWINDYYGNPFEISPAVYNLNDRPCLIGEMPGKPTLMGETWITKMDDCFNAAYTLGYQGHYPWTSNNAGSGDFGSLATFGAASTTFKDAHVDLVYPPLMQCSKPELGDDMTLCGATLPLLLDSKTSTKANVNYSWYKNDVLLANETGTTLNISGAGTYKVVRDSVTCSRKDEIVVSSTLPLVNLGENILLCTQTSALLDAGISGTGISYSWAKDGVKIATATNKTFIAYSAGTYTATIAATSCTSQSDEIIITSNLPKVSHDTICTAGVANLSVLATTGEYEWYDSEKNGTLLKAGNTYTPTITSSATYYVEDASSVNVTVGPEAANHGLTGEENSGNIGILFTAEKPFSITSITVLPFIYNLGTISVTFDLKNSGGTTIKSYTSEAVATIKTQGSIPLSDSYKLTFNPPIAVETAGNYQLVPSGGNSIVSFGGADFTNMGEAGVIKITGDTRSYKADGYPAMFDIVVQSGSSCARTPVLAVIDPNAPNCGTIDTDNDGTPDNLDGCPNDPNKIAAGNCGCGVAETACGSDMVIALKQGWNLVSLNIDPTLSDVASIFPNATVVKTQNVFWNKLQAVFLNSLINIEAGVGYLVYNSVAENVTIEGTLTINNSPLTINNGWNLIGIPSSTSLPLSTYPEAAIIKDFEGFYEAGNGMSTLTILETGKAYFVKK